LLAKFRGEDDLPESWIASLLPFVQLVRHILFLLGFVKSGLPLSRPVGGVLSARDTFRELSIVQRPCSPRMSCAPHIVADNSGNASSSSLFAPFAWRKHELA